MALKESTLSKISWLVLVFSVVASSANELKCSVANSSGSVHYVSDGKYKRCYSVVVPQNKKGPFPVLFWFHGAGGNGGNCGGGRKDIDFGMSLGEYAQKYVSLCLVVRLIMIM